MPFSWTQFSGIPPPVCRLVRSNSSKNSTNILQRFCPLRYGGYTEQSLHTCPRRAQCLVGMSATSIAFQMDEKPWQMEIGIVVVRSMLFVAIDITAPLGQPIQKLNRDITVNRSIPQSRKYLRVKPVYSLGRSPGNQGRYLWCESPEIHTGYWIEVLGSAQGGEGIRPVAWKETPIRPVRKGFPSCRSHVVDPRPDVRTLFGKLCEVAL